MLQSPLLSRLVWLRHGFGTRDSAPPPPERTATVKQVHSAVAVHGTSAGVAGQGDALFTQTPGLVLAVRTADCLPVLLADQRTRSVAAVHSGWRGTAAGVVPATLDGMRRLFGTAPADLAVAIGPGIQACCFEVGAEVAREFQGLFPERADLDQRTSIDLAEAVRRQLSSAGVRAEQIHLTGQCTVDDAERFHSFRRDRELAGRLVSWVEIVAE